MGTIIVKQLADLFAIAASDFQSGMAVINHLGHISDHCLGLLRHVDYRRLAKCDSKSYRMFADGDALSRPVRDSLFVRDRDEMARVWRNVTNSVQPRAHRFDAHPADVDAVLYTAVTAFSVCYDLWRPGSRKTPGTFFEVVVGSLIQAAAPEMTRRAHVALREPGESVSTDLVFLKPGGAGGLVVPVKITTRERIVQPFAHQRILDAVYGAGRFRSALVCVSEMQRQRDKGANAICVPGTIRLFQRYLAPLAGLYYLDPPARYLEADVTDFVPVRTLGQLLVHDLPARLEPEQI